MTLSRTWKSLILGLSASALLAVSAPSFAADLVMWERSGGNKGMVDKLVAMWNAKNPRPQDQPHLHPARRDGGQARPGDRRPATFPT